GFEAPLDEIDARETARAPALRSTKRGPRWPDGDLRYAETAPRAAKQAPRPILSTHQNTPGFSDSAEADDHFGAALAAGNFGGGCGALAVPREDVGILGNAGAVHLIFGNDPFSRGGGELDNPRASSAEVDP
ncbi:MAG: hypothetical protein MI919_30230, partial [Holophagales bacterium]|nr:hypothetical protein [Holophagales bacterium]